MVEDILNYLGFKNRYDFVKEEVDSLHSGISALITIDRENIGFIGKVHPSINKDNIYVFELSLSKILDLSIKPIKYKEISKYPSITKDLAFILDDNITSKEVMDTIKKKGGKMLQSINVFDVYKGENLEEGKKSLAFSLVFQDSERTLSDEEVMEVFENIYKEVEKKHNAILRDK